MRTLRKVHEGHEVRLYPALGGAGYSAPGISAGPAHCETCDAQGSWSRPWGGKRYRLLITHSLHLRVMERPRPDPWVGEFDKPYHYEETP